MNYRKKQSCVYDDSLLFAGGSKYAHLIFHSAEVIPNRKTPNRRRNYREGLAYRVVLGFAAGFVFFVGSSSALVAAEVPPISITSQGADGTDGFFDIFTPHLDGFPGSTGGPVSATLAGSDFIHSTSLILSPCRRSVCKVAVVQVEMEPLILSREWAGMVDLGRAAAQ